MAVNIFKDELQHAQMFGKPVLTTNWLIPRETVPDGWYCYDMRGTESDPAAHAELVDYNSFLAFAVEGSDSNVDSFDSIDSYDELKKIRDELAMPGDPVDLLTGSFTWNYTDFALYGESLFNILRNASWRGNFPPGEAGFRRNDCVYFKKSQRSMAGKDPPNGVLRDVKQALTV